jgi:hypothetical protein
MSNARTVERYVEAVLAEDWATVAEILDPDVVATYPQSGEVFRGRDNYLAVLSNYPGGSPKLVIEETHGQREEVSVQAMPFGLPSITVSGGGDAFFGTGKVEYPDGSIWHFVSLIEFSGGRLVKETVYFGPTFDAPEWRAPYAEGRPPTE